MTDVLIRNKFFLHMSYLYRNNVVVVVVIIIIIITRHELGLDRPVSASSNSLFKRLASRLRPFGQ